MSIKVVLGEGESLPEALRRLRQLVSLNQPRRYHLRRDYFMKPSDVRRRKRNNGRHNARIRRNLNRNFLD